MPESYKDRKRERYLSTIFDAIDYLEVSGLIEQKDARALFIQQNTLTNDQLKKISLNIFEYGDEYLLELLNKLNTNYQVGKISLR